MSDANTLEVKILEKDSNLEVNEQFVEQYCPKIIRAIKKIKTWLMLK